MSGLLRPLGSAGLSPSHHLQPWYEAQLGAHLLPPSLLLPSLPGPSYSICLFWQPESILKVPSGAWNRSSYALLDQKGSQASQQAGIKFLSLETPVSSGRRTVCLAFAFTDVESLHSFWGIVLFPEHSKQFPTLWPFSQLSFRTRCHPISVVSETLLIW